MSGKSRRVLVLRCPDWLDDDALAVDGPPADGARDGGSAGARAFEPVVAIVEEFCPHVEVLRPGLAAIPARGPARYFGGEAALAARVEQAVSDGGFACQVGVADGVFAAGLAAQAGPAGLLVPPGETPQFLAGLPVAALPFDALGLPELAILLPRLGICTLGEFASLPAAEAGSRFGTQGAIAHRLACGLDPRPLAPRPPRLDLSVEQSFDPPAEQSEPVIFTAKALAEQMHARLAGHGLACVRMQVLVLGSDGQEFSRLWRHDGLLSALAVAERVRWQLDGWRGLDNQGGITLLRLVPDQLVRATGRQLSLWGDAVVSDRVARCALRVQAMLGPEAVTRPSIAGGRRPVEQVVLTPFGDAVSAHDPARTRTPNQMRAGKQRPADQPWPGQIPAPAPATVYTEPLPASVTDGAGQPVSVSGRSQLSAPPAWLAPERGSPRGVTGWAGPWPVTERWWDPELTRRQARFQMITDDGSAWLVVLQGGQWLIEARYD
jgi:protein ImuB